MIFTLSSHDAVALYLVKLWGTNLTRGRFVCTVGIYYPSGSLRAKLCVQGKHMIYKYCMEKKVPHKRIGKLIVAKDEEQVTKLRNYLENGKKNGVNDLKVS